MKVRVLTRSDHQLLVDAGRLFDGEITPEGAKQFLSRDGHHVLIAYEGQLPTGFVTGVEMTHLDKGTEIFLCELGVDDEFRRKGIGTALVSALARLAKSRGSYGMWVLTDDGNDAGVGTYSKAGGIRRSNQWMFDWNFATDR
ncbi:MAG: GNAT family N-acetyltransferase [Chloroflexi bacterium]|nr:GNAT family N-acetyltransferase [Chloroflexota bacterium]